MLRVKDEIFAWRVKEGTAAEELFVEPQFDENGRAFVQVFLLLSHCDPHSLSAGGGEEKDCKGKGESDKTWNGKIGDQTQRLSPHCQRYHLLLWFEGASCTALPTAGEIESKSPSK